MNFIPYGRQDISDEDIDAVVEILRSDFLTQGPAVEKFETSLAKYSDAKYAVAVNSATSALHIACLALGISNKDIVWTSPITFVATANSALYCGASIDFVDIDFETNNISINSLREKLEQAKNMNCLPSVLIPVHMAGTSCDMESIFKLSKEYGFKIIEDASHAIGGTYKKSKIGASAYSDITVFSFHPVKIITTGEGGAALTNSKEIFEKLSLFRTHGITRDADQMTHSSDGGWYYQQIALGLNYRITDIQAALGTSQMSRIDSFVLKRNELADRYNKHLSNLPIVLPKTLEDTYSSYHLYIIKLSENSPIGRKELYDGLKANNIGVNVHYIPVHLQPYYKNIGFSEGDFPEAERFYKNAISIPLHPKLSIDEQDYVIDRVSEYLK
jgi:UDP-4-amino-4,6-dideoxy-N-acetyl-beta-L-altrosamine transaminase